MGEFKKVFVVKDEVEASFWDMILQERDIPHILRSYHDSAYDGLFQMQKGWGVLYAAEEDHDAIHQIRQELDPTAESSEEEAP